MTIQYHKDSKRPMNQIVRERILTWIDLEKYTGLKKHKLKHAIKFDAFPRTRKVVFAGRVVNYWNRAEVMDWMVTRDKLCKNL